MKKIIITMLISALSLSLLVACSSEEPTQPDNENNVSESQENEQNNNSGQIVTDASVFGTFSSKDFQGNDVTQEIFAQNKLTMVNIWATFCGPCISEMPDLGELSKEYADKGFAIVGIPVDIADDTGNINSKLYDEAVDIIETTKADYVHIIPTAEMYRGKLASVYSVPETVFVDSHGNQVGISYFGARSKEQWKEIIDELLGEVQ